MELDGVDDAGALKPGASVDGVDVPKAGAVTDGAGAGGAVVVLGASVVEQAASASLSFVTFLVGTPAPPRAATSRSSSLLRSRSYAAVRQRASARV